MADLLASVSDLRTLLGEDAEALSDAEATLLLELATGAVQAAADQRILEVTSDSLVMGTAQSWLSLPERPVIDVTSVDLDGTAVSDYRRFGSRLWRESGWAQHPRVPGMVTVRYRHGYAESDPEIQLARSAVLAVAAKMFTNASGATGISIDDYRETFAASDSAGDVPDQVRKALRRRYGRRGGMVPVG